MKLFCFFSLAILFSGIVSGQAPSISGCPSFPANSIWNTPVDTLPVDAHSADYIRLISTPGGLRYDITIPVNIVPGTQPKVPINISYPDESDPGPYPIAANAQVEAGSDRHVIVVDRDNCILYETYNSVLQPDGSWKVDSSAKWSLLSNALRPASWTSADAAGLPIMPGLVRYDEILSGQINHALRFTAPNTQRLFVWPGRHYASDDTSNTMPPMGQRFRLKAGVDISGYPANVRVILQALKRYGLMLADNGIAWEMQMAVDPRWSAAELDTLRTIVGSNLEAVDVSSLMIDSDSGQAVSSNPPAVTVSPASVTMGPSWTQQFSATVTGSSLGVTWSMNPTLGTLSASGFYTAPSSVTGSPIVTVTATLADGSTAGRALVALQAAPVTLSSVSVSPDSVVGGSNVTVTVTLTGPAPSGGVPVTLTGSNPAFPAANVNLGEGLVFQALSMPTSSVPVPTSLTIAAAYNGTTVTSSAVTLIPNSAGAASYVRTDTTTSGNWKGVYGADGYNIINDSVSYPSYLTVTASGNLAYTWVASTSDGRALQKASSTTGRIAASWYSPVAFTVDLNFSYADPHQLAIYFLDWDGVRTQRVDILDANNRVLDTRTLSGFNSGRYLVWNVSGHVAVRITNMGSNNGVLSGIFFGSGGNPPANNPAPTITSLAPLSGTAGGAAFTLTVNGTGFVSGSSVVNWNGNGRATTYVSASQLRAAVTAAEIGTAGTAQVTVFNPTPGGGTSGSLPFTINTANNPAPTITSLTPASGTAGGAAFTLTVNGTGFVSGTSVVNWNGNGRATTYVSATQLGAAITAADIGTAGTAQVTVFNPAPGGGTSGSLPFTINTAGGPGATASYVKTDTTTSGNWKGVYGADGYNIINDTVNYPSYVTVTPTGFTPYVWANPTLDTRGLQKAVLSGRLAAKWYTVTKATIDLQFSSGTHQLALYVLDWDAGGARSETIDILDSNNTVLDTRAVTSMQNGKYVVWNVSGHVVVRITRTGTNNAVVSGIFFDSAGGPPANNPAPTITSLTPASGTAGGAAFTLTVNGTGFVSGTSVVNWNGNGRATTYVSATQLLAAITAADIGTAGTAQVTVFSPTPGGGTSGSLPFTINTANNPAPTITSLTPASGTAGGAAFTLTVNGTGFVSGTSVVNWNGNGRATTYVNATQLRAAITAADIGTAGTAQITVFNPTPGGGTSGSLPFTINTAGGPGATASYVKTDTTTSGNWKGVYGADGYNIINDTVNYPSYVTVTPTGFTPYVWANPTLDTRGLQKAVLSGRLAAKWYTVTKATIDLQFSSGTHQLALYVLDWDAGGARSETIDILDTNNTVLDTRAVTSMQNGKYVVWNVSGHVVVRITRTGTNNAVVSGIFFDSVATGTPPTSESAASYGEADTAASGN